MNYCIMALLPLNYLTNYCLGYGIDNSVKDFRFDIRMFYILSVLKKKEIKKI